MNLWILTFRSFGFHISHSVIIIFIFHLSIQKSNEGRFFSVLRDHSISRAFRAHMNTFFEAYAALKCAQNVWRNYYFIIYYLLIHDHYYHYYSDLVTWVKQNHFWIDDDDYYDYDGHLNKKENFVKKNYLNFRACCSIYAF